MKIDYALLAPEFALAGVALAILGIDWLLPREKKSWLAWLSVLGLLGVFGSVFTLLDADEKLYGGLLLIDDYSTFFKAVFVLMGVFIVLASVDYVQRHLKHPGEYYGLVLLSVLAMMLLSDAGELLTAYISLELLSFSLYALASFATDNPKSNEAGIKYILFGAFSSALLLYGLSLLYGVLGVTTFDGMKEAIEAGEAARPAFTAALVLLIAGLGFKIAAVPFHMWVPDVYEGAPTPITAYLAVASKGASFALLLRLFTVGFGAEAAADLWQPILAGLAAATMLTGNLVAIAQRNIKRLLAYSSIGQAGFLLIGVVAQSDLGATALVFHIVGYGVTNLAAFITVIAVFNATGKENIEDYAGLSERNPFLALVLSVALFSLAGLPFFVGFTTKFYLFISAANEGFLWLAALGIVMSLVSFYYYLMVIKQMYLHPAAEKTPVASSHLLRGVLGALTAGAVLFGVFPQPLVDAIQRATRVLF